VSRTKHTVPARVLAPRRVAAPYAPRAARNPTDARRQSRALKHLGLIPVRLPSAPAAARGAHVRIHAERPTPGYQHPATPAAIRAFLIALGPRWTYGLRSVTLAQRPPQGAAATLAFGELCVSGEVRFFEQPHSPWHLPGTLAPADQQRLQAAGALVQADSSGLRTTVHWPGHTLRDFMLRDVLAHELAHHQQQQYTGKRTVRIRRTHDHEAFAQQLVRRLAAQCQRDLRA